MSRKMARFGPSATVWAAQGDSGRPNRTSQGSRKTANIHGNSGVTWGILAKNPIASAASDSPYGN
jgi:hypothetical protein